MNDEHKSSIPSAFWPVTFPVLVGAALLTAVLVWAAAASSGGSDLSRFADLSAVLMIILMMIITIVPLLLLAGLAYGLFRLYRVIPKGTRWLLEALDQVQEFLGKAAGIAVEPIIRIKSTGAAVKKIWKQDTGGPGRGSSGSNIEIQTMKGNHHD